MNNRRVQKVRQTGGHVQDFERRPIRRNSRAARSDSRPRARKKGIPPIPATRRAPKQNHCIDACAPFGQPIDILEVQPQCEFIQRQSGAGAVEHRHEAACQNRSRCRLSPRVEKPAIPDGKKNENSPREMVNVPAVDVNVVKRPDMKEIGPGEYSRDRKHR